jgi:hypothetical protein
MPWCAGSVAAAAALRNKASVSAGNPGAPAWDDVHPPRLKAASRLLAPSNAAVFASDGTI